MDVKQGQYRLRIVDGSNSRFYQLSFSNGMSFIQIGSDGGYLKTSVPETSKLISPGERIDILVDFSNVAAGQKIILQNTLEKAAGYTTVGHVMQFTVNGQAGFAAKQLPADLNPPSPGSFPTLPSPDKTRILTLADIGGENGSNMMLLDGQEWSAPVSETPKLGSTEDWVIVNPTMDAHPIHIHLIQFQVVSRQTLNFDYLSEWTRVNGGNPPFKNATVNVSNLSNYLIGSPSATSPSEQGWKDTVIVNSGEVVTIRARWAEQNGNAFPFDATVGPGYVWHCHLLEHEDNEMMRPYTVIGSSSSLSLIVTVGIVAVMVVAALLAALIYLKHLRHRGVKAKE